MTTQVSLSRAKAEDVRKALEDPAIGLEDVRDILKNPKLTKDIIMALAENSRLPSSYDTRLALVNHPAIPVGVALRLVSAFTWRDLARLAEDFRRPAPIRIRAAKLLADRIEDLGVGQLTSLAKVAGRPVIRILARSTDGRVIAALLWNPRLQADDVLKLAMNPESPAQVLEAIARSAKWGGLYAIKMALAQHPSCPAADALRSLRGISSSDLRRIQANPDAPRLIQTGIDRLLAGETAVPAEVCAASSAEPIH
jgi:hypothetical protein